MAANGTTTNVAKAGDVSIRHVGVLGGGAWGTALAQSMRSRGLAVTLWAYEFETVTEINDNHTNRVYLPGVRLDPGIKATAKARDLAACDVILLVAPSQFVRLVARELSGFASGKPVVVCTKGFEEDTGRLMSDVVSETLPDAKVAVLSGPSFAGEVARSLPAALTLASKDEESGRQLAAALGHRAFRVYWTDDMTGAQVGGAVKNVLAIAAGIVDGRRFGASAHAAVTTRGFAELVRFGLKLGARFETLTGLSGLGDLVLTCSSPQSRNMSLGQELGRGKAVADILSHRKSVAEGVSSARAVVALAQRLGVDMPICEAVNRVVKGEATVDEAIESVLSRPFKPEAYMHGATA
jgi:glycerol-3-phosphate dehydrogenase (NAD(P)+)